MRSGKTLPDRTWEFKLFAGSWWSKEKDETMGNLPGANCAWLFIGIVLLGETACAPSTQYRLYPRDAQSVHLTFSSDDATTPIYSRAFAPPTKGKKPYFPMHFDTPGLCSRGRNRVEDCPIQCSGAIKDGEVLRDDPTLFREECRYSGLGEILAQRQLGSMRETTFDLQERLDSVETPWSNVDKVTRVDETWLRPVGYAALIAGGIPALLAASIGAGVFGDDAAVRKKAWIGAGAGASLAAVGLIAIPLGRSETIVYPLPGSVYHVDSQVAHPNEPRKVEPPARREPMPSSDSPQNSGARASSEQIAVESTKRAGSIRDGIREIVFAKGRYRTDQTTNLSTITSSTGEIKTVFTDGAVSFQIKRIIDGNVLENHYIETGTYGHSVYDKAGYVTSMLPAHVRSDYSIGVTAIMTAAGEWLAASEAQNQYRDLSESGDNDAAFAYCSGWGLMRVSNKGWAAVDGGRGEYATSHCKYEISTAGNPSGTTVLSVTLVEFNVGSNNSPAMAKPQVWQDHAQLGAFAIHNNLLYRFNRLRSHDGWKVLGSAPSRGGESVEVPENLAVTPGATLRSIRLDSDLRIMERLFEGISGVAEYEGLRLQAPGQDKTVTWKVTSSGQVTFSEGAKGRTTDGVLRNLP